MRQLFQEEYIKNNISSIKHDLKENMIIINQNLEKSVKEIIDQR